MHALRAPLNQLLKKDTKWSWSFECQNAFEEIIKALMSDFSLAYHDPNKEIYIATDASNLGLGVVLLHKDDNGQLKAVAHTSRMLLPTEKFQPNRKRSTKYICSKSFINFYIEEALYCK